MKIQNFPNTLSEILETNHPFIEYKQQIVVTTNWPNANCKQCYGTGYIGVLINKMDRIPKGRHRNLVCPCKSVDENGKAKKYKHCCEKRVRQYKNSKNALLTCGCVGFAKSLKPEKKITEEVK